MEMILQQVAGSQMMSLLDGFSIYNQIKVKMTDKYKTTFITHWGTFAYEHMPFGLSNAGATFQRAMQISFDDLIGKIIHIYLDDLTVYSKNRSDHFGHLRKVLMRCKKFGISLNPSKSFFAITKGKLLGHVVSDLGISIDPERIVAILNLPAPISKKEVQSFMGIINFVCRFVLDFAIMVKPIHNFLKQDRSFSWTDDFENAFVRIKKAISYAPVLAKPDFEKEFIIYTNSTEEVVFDILMQCDDQVNEKPVAYMSQSLSDDDFKYSYIEKHAFALVKVVEKFCHFILGKHTLVKVPLPIVKFLLSQTYLSGKLAHWLAKIQEHDLTLMTSKTTRGRDLSLHLAQHAEASEEIDEQDSSLSALFYIDSQILPVAGHPRYKNLVRIIKRLIEDKPLQWHTLLTYTLWVDRTTTKVSTGCTPFQLVYGQEAILPTELEISSLRLILQVEELNFSNISQRMNALLALEEQRTFSLDNIKRRQQILKRYFNKSAKAVKFNVNEKVSLWDSTHVDRGRHSKFQKLWLGPFKIVFILGVNLYILKDLKE
jgi:hypothetical protein